VTVRKLQSQEAQHDSGAILRSHGRDAMQFELNGRTMTIAVDRGIGADLFYLPMTPRWDDNEPVTADVAATLKPIITEIEEFWGSRADFRTVTQA
jgi:hypothetical protein